MGYSVKWVGDNLGVSRDALRYYEKEKLLPTNENRNATNNYRNYCDEDIQRIWGIKLLIGIGFSAKEIRSLINNPDFDFDSAIAKKVAELERKHDENITYLQFAKSIKLTGRIPTTSKIGSVRFDDFLAFARENWYFYDDPRSAPFMQAIDTLVSKQPQEWSPDDVKCILKMAENFNPEEMLNAYSLHGYYRVISDMQDLGYKSETVQAVVKRFHEYLVKHNTVPELDGKITPQFMAKFTVPSFLGGDIAILNERNYGKDGCLFIAQALAYYGGYNIDDL